VVDIVDESFRDLLLAEDAKAEPLTAVKRDTTYGMSVEGATVAPVRTASHVRSLLAQAQAARKVGDREAASSMVTMLTVRSSNTESGQSSVGKLTLVDLADAQLAVKKGEAPPDDQNKSIAAFVGVIDALAASKKKQIDFDSSKLTELLQDSLGGNSKSMMLLCVDPAPVAATLTSQCLSFAEKAKGVKLGAASKNKDSHTTAMTKVNTTMSALTQHANKGEQSARGKP
jgi:kinesin family protein C2/C3